MATVQSIESNDFIVRGPAEFSIDASGDRRKFVPTLFLGLGGTGKDILLRFRKRLYDEYGMPKERFATFLVLDTDTQPYTPAGEEKQVFEPVEFRHEQGEFIGCAISPEEYRSVETLVHAERDGRFVKWVHKDLFRVLSDQSVQVGAGTHRQIGRMAFFLHHRDIRRQITEYLKGMRAFAQTNPVAVFRDRPGEVDKAHMEVVIVTSLAGGTGAGMFIDTAYLINDILRKERTLHGVDTHVSLIAILPSVFAEDNPNYRDRFLQNGYAALLEMEHYGMWREEDDPWKSSESEAIREGKVLAGRKTRVEFWVNWEDPHADEQPIPAQAWGTCYLVDNINVGRPGAPGTKREIFQMVADYLHMDFGSTSFAVAKRSMRSNHAQFREKMATAPVRDLREEAKSPDGRPRFLFVEKYSSSFSSFGLAEIYIDKDRIDRSAAYRLAARLIRRRWLNETKYPDGKYERWANEDLGGSRIPPNALGVISFFPDEVRKELFREGDTDWLGRFDAGFARLQQGDPAQGGIQLRAALEKHQELLSTAGKVRRTLEGQFRDLQGDATQLGRLRKRLQDLTRQRFSENGAEPALRLLAEYRKQLDAFAKTASAEKAQKLESDASLLARQVDAAQVPFPCRGIALDVEYRRACESARNAVARRSAAGAGRYLESLYGWLGNYVGSPEAGEKTRDEWRTLHEQFARIRGFLNGIVKKLDDRFDELQKVAQSERKRSLVPKWKPEEYDREMDAVLIHDPQVGTEEDGISVNWARLETAILEQSARDAKGDRIPLADLIDRWIAASTDWGKAMPEIAERLQRACRAVLKGGIRLENFGKGNVVDYLSSREGQEHRAKFLNDLVDYGAPYFPLISNRIQRLEPAPYNVLGRPSGSDEAGEMKAAAITAEIRGIAREKGAGNVDDIHRIEDGPPTSIVLVRELGGLPLYYYNGLAEMAQAYRDPTLDVGRKTCHIRWRETEWDLPDIKVIEPQLRGIIRDNCPYVLWMLILRRIKRDGEGMFCVDVPQDFGTRVVYLGTRINRIIKHACNHEGVRAYLADGWQRWVKRASTTAVAVLYCAIRETLHTFPNVERAGEESDPPPIGNCYCLLLSETEKLLMQRGEEGSRWVELLRPPREDDDRREQKEARYRQIASIIREKCLEFVSEDMRLYQVHEQRIEEIRLPASSSEAGIAEPRDEPSGGQRT